MSPPKEPRTFKDLRISSLFSFNTGHYQYRLKKIEPTRTNGKIRFNAVPVLFGESGTNRLDLNPAMYIPAHYVV